MTNEEKMRKHAKHYTPCYCNDCPRHDNCLRWLIREYINPDDKLVTTINPMNPDVRTGRCTYYRQKQIVKYAIGYVHIFNDIPYPQARSIKRRLIHDFTRKRFYEYRNGVRPIPPEHQQLIEKVCREEGWMGEIRYDEWEEDYLW